MSLSCSTIFQFSSKVQVLILLFIFFQFYSVVHRNSLSTIRQVLFFLVGLVFWLRFGDSFVCHNPRGIYVCHSPAEILSCAYTISSYCQISISCTIPSGSSCPPSRQCQLMVSHWSLSDNKSFKVSRTLLSILPDLNLVVVWIISTHPVISNSSSPCTNLLLTVLRAPITICIIVTFIFHSF